MLVVLVVAQPTPALFSWEWEEVDVDLKSEMLVMVMVMRGGHCHRKFGIGRWVKNSGDEAPSCSGGREVRRRERDSCQVELTYLAI